jgi:hypothetical protein
MSENNTYPVTVYCSSPASTTPEVEDFDPATLRFKPGPKKSRPANHLSRLSPDLSRAAKLVHPTPIRRGLRNRAAWPPPPQRLPPVVTRAPAQEKQHCAPPGASSSSRPAKPPPTHRISAARRRRRCRVSREPSLEKPMPRRSAPDGWSPPCTIGRGRHSDDARPPPIRQHSAVRLRPCGSLPFRPSMALHCALLCFLWSFFGHTVYSHVRLIVLMLCASSTLLQHV